MGVSGVSKSLYRARMGFKYQTVYFLFVLFLLFLFTPTPPPLAHFLCSCLSVINLSRCSLPVTYLAVVFFPPLCLYSGPHPPPHAISSLVVSSHPFLPRTPHCELVFFAEQLSCHRVTRVPVKVTVGNFGHQAVVGWQHMDAQSSVPSRSGVLKWMPRRFALLAAIITRLNTCHLQVHET